MTCVPSLIGQVKAEGGGSTHRWCKSRGIEQQRFYEITKLKEQFEEILQVCLLWVNCTVESVCDEHP